MTDETTAGDVDQGDAGLLTGIAHDGPLDGAQLTSRRPLGVLLVDKPARECWLYDWRDGAFYARTTKPMPLLDSGADDRFRAAEEGEYDVLAAPWVGGDPDTVDVDGDPDAGDDPGVDVDDADQADPDAGLPGVDVTSTSVTGV